MCNAGFPSVTVAFLSAPASMKVSMKKKGGKEEQKNGREKRFI
jgi:hypothetical protein